MQQRVKCVVYKPKELFLGTWGNLLRRGSTYYASPSDVVSFRNSVVLRVRLFLVDGSHFTGVVAVHGCRTESARVNKLADELFPAHRSFGNFVAGIEVQP